MTSFLMRVVGADYWHLCGRATAELVLRWRLWSRQDAMSAALLEITRQSSANWAALGRTVTGGRRRWDCTKLAVACRIKPTTDVMMKALLLLHSAPTVAYQWHLSAATYRTNWCLHPIISTRLSILVGSVISVIWPVKSSSKWPIMCWVGR